MNQPWEWEESDLLALIAEKVQESVSLDYKQCDALDKESDKKKTEVSKDISAFANSAGGTIVYGMCEDKHFPVAIDVGFDPAVLSKEWLDQVLNSRIQRRIDGVRIKQVALPTIRPGRVAYVVSIPQSMRAPHQASDKRFYKRFNFESVPMEEYEVRDAGRRSEAPDLAIVFKVRESERVGSGTPADPHRQLVKLMPVISNECPAPARDILIDLYLDARLSVAPQGGEFDLIKRPQTVRIVDGHPVACHAYQRNWGVGDVVVFSGVTVEIASVPMVFEVPGPGRYLLSYRVRAPWMQERTEVKWLDWADEPQANGS